MAVLIVKVKCFHCNKEVAKAQSLPIKSINNGERYSCFDCFKKNKTPAWGFGDKVPLKRELYCERCNYYFASKIKSCPYCNKADLVSEANVSINDLL
ncbi:MAG: hypothetical protein AABW48_04120 [Nanoarchaeota archaeon]